ncbi:hypothetical protein B0H11DRAFT_2227772 [Mycena galericulata]|nr:hypothetical protein B0H11DRAFT_2227772 [Mycena galericulata]
MFAVYGICLGTTFLVFFVVRRLPRVFPLPRIIHRRTLEGVRLLLDPFTVSTATLLRSRASPNARLLMAFRLTNTFVSADPAVHSKFVQKSIILLREAKQDWKRFTDVAVQAVDSALPDRLIPFHNFVRSVTLRTIIVGLVDPRANIASLDANDVDIVTELITDIWILSKRPDPIPEHLLETLNSHLRRLIPDEAAFPNPLDFLIPTWETLWRVVAVTLAHIHLDPEACRAFQDLNDNPSLDQFRISRLGGAYPIADIESAQRSAFWGSHPEGFDPARFLREPDLAKDLLAFGCGPLKCKAANWAPMAAAVIVGAIVNGVDGVRYDFVRGNKIGGRKGWEGWFLRKVNADT